MSGNDGLRTDSLAYGKPYRYGYGDYLGDMTKFFTRSLAYCSGNVWNARNFTQAWNVYNHQAAQPYGFYYNYTGRPHYIVADPFQMPYQTALELHGYANPYVPTAAGTAAKLQQMTEQAALEAKVGQTVMDLQQRVEIGKWKDAECLADQPELKKEAEELSKKIKNILDKLHETMENKEKLSAQDVGAKIDALIEVAKPLIEEANTLIKNLTEAKAEYDKKKAEEVADKARQDAEDAANNAGGDDPVGDTSVTTTEGDKKMNTDQLATEYGVKKPLALKDDAENVSELAQEVKTALGTMNDTEAYNKIIEILDTSKSVNADNIVGVIEELGSNYDLYTQIQTLNSGEDKNVLLKFFTLVETRINNLKAPYLTDVEAKEMKDAIKQMKNKLSGTDLPGTSPKITYRNKEVDCTQLFKSLAADLKGKGTQSDFAAKIKDKQKERTTKATADFYKDHATSRPGKEVNGTPAPPAGVTYLPNSKEFQWKYDSSTVFKGKSFKELGDKILASKKTEVIAKWNDILKEMDKKLKDKTAS